MDKSVFDLKDIDIAWCPGCGNFPILIVLKQALAELNLPPEKVVMATGIGQAAKLPHYINTHFFNGLHGRGLPAATAIKAVNPSLTVIHESGDGCTYGEGGNHFIHAIRRNPSLTCIVHNNMVYGLTKGQASPTSQRGYKTPVQVEGVFLEPFNPLAIAISLDAPFVARAFAGDREQTKEILKKAISHRGFCLVDIFQPCVTFNRINTFQWFKQNTYYVDDSYDPHDRVAAFQKALEKEKLPLGVIYLGSDRPTFEEQTGLYGQGETPVYEREVNKDELAKLVFQVAGSVQTEAEEEYRWPT